MSEHLSNPNGCDPDCKVCALERDEECARIARAIIAANPPVEGRDYQVIPPYELMPEDRHIPTPKELAEKIVTKETLMKMVADLHKRNKSLLEAAKIGLQMADNLKEASDSTMTEDFKEDRQTIKKAIAEEEASL